MLPFFMKLFSVFKSLPPLPAEIFHDQSMCKLLEIKVPAVVSVFCQVDVSFIMAWKFLTRVYPMMVHWFISCRKISTLFFLEFNVSRFRLVKFFVWSSVSIELMEVKQKKLFHFHLKVSLCFQVHKFAKVGKSR